MFIDCVLPLYIIFMTATFGYISTHMHVYTDSHTYTHKHMRTDYRNAHHVVSHTLMHVHTFMIITFNLLTCPHTYTYTYTQIHKHTDSHTHGLTNIHTHRLQENNIMLFHTCTLMHVYNFMNTTQICIHIHSHTHTHTD